MKYPLQFALYKDKKYTPETNVSDLVKANSSINDRANYSTFPNCEKSKDFLAPQKPLKFLATPKPLKGFGDKGAIIIDGFVYTNVSQHLCTEGLFLKLPKKYRESFFSIDVTKRYYPAHQFVNEFIGNANLRFDGFLDDEDYKRISESNLRNFRYNGLIYLLGEKNWVEEDTLYVVAGDFEDLPLLLYTRARVRITPSSP